jgi:GNAT superfamily N-acetyltransferase
MEVVQLTAEHVPLYLCCLGDCSEEATREAGPHRAAWYAKMKDRGLRVLLGKDDDGRIGGMIQYLPAEHSMVRGEGLYFIYCIWVYQEEGGGGSSQGHGMGRMLLQAAEVDARELGAKGIAAWGLSLPFWMQASWFRKHGYVDADTYGIAVLVWKAFTDEARPPEWVKARKTPEPSPGKVTVTALVNGWCTVQNMVHERAKRAAAEFGDAVLFREIDTSERDALEEWGHADALFIGREQVQTGPPPSYEELRERIAGAVRRL